MDTDGLLLCVEREKNQVLLQTSERLVRQSRNLIRAGGALAALAGFVLAWWMIGALLLAPVGILAMLVVPRFVRTATLLEIDLAQNLLAPRQAGAATNAVVALADIARLEGAHEVQGWDPRSVVYAVAEGGERTPILIFPGAANERVAEHACRTLGQLLNKSATYAGPFGTVTNCYKPAAPPSRGAVTG